MEKKNAYDLVLRKIFDMKIKQGNEMKKVFVDETEFLKRFYILKGMRLFAIDISSKKVDEVEFTKGKEVVYICNTQNNENIIIILKNGLVYSLDSKYKVIQIKNFPINSLFVNNKKKSDTINFDKFKIFCSNNIEKMFIANDKYMAIWYQNDIKTTKNTNKIEEISGTFYHISLENEKQAIFGNLNNFNAIEKLTACFYNNYYYGSFGRVIYVILTPFFHIKKENIQSSGISSPSTTSMRLYLIDYMFKFDNCHKSKIADEFQKVNEHIKSIEKRVIYSYIQYPIEEIKETINNKEKIIIKLNNNSTCCVILINAIRVCNSCMLFYMTETSRTSTFKLLDIFNRLKHPPSSDDGKLMIWVEDVEWMCNDWYLVILFSQGYFCIVDINCNLISFIDSTNSLISNNIENMSCPSHFYNPKLKFNEKLSLISSKKRTDYFIIYSSNYMISFQVNNKLFETKVLTLKCDNFDDFLYSLKFYQLFLTDTENNNVLFDKIHNYIIGSLSGLYQAEAETTITNEYKANIYNFFVRFIRIFRSLNQIHETNLTILLYLMGTSNDFFYFLLQNKEIWLGFLFINLCENYVLKHLRIKIPKNKLYDDELSKHSTAYMALNPYFQQNASLVSYDCIGNKVLHIRLRLILIFNALIEFRNNQAVNINILYFILAKLCSEKIKKYSLLDDIQLIVKAIIRNYKYLKSENQRAGGEEYILNGLTLNLKTELLSHLIHSRVPRDEVKFDFFSEFYSLEELHSFVETNELYCRGEEDMLVNEYEYINHVGIIQKWILFFTSGFFQYLFDDIKAYMNLHIQRYFNQEKSKDEISPDEYSLSSIINFNITFFSFNILNFINNFILFFGKKNEYNYENETLFLNEIVNTCIPFISPIDVPFIILEFYILEDNKNKKTTPIELNLYIYDKIIQYSKIYNLNVYDAFDFFEVIINNGFKSNSEIYTTKLQKILFSSLMFYIFLIHKFFQLHFFELEIKSILNLVENLDPALKLEVYETWIVMLNGILRYYLIKETRNGKLSLNNLKYLEIVLGIIKTLFYKILREEPYSLRKNISEIIYISPSGMKPFLIEGGLFYEYKNLKNLTIKSFNNSKNLLINVFTKSITSFQNTDLIKNIFEEFQKNESILTILFEQDLVNSFTEQFQYTINNILSQFKSNNLMIFYIENDREYIQKIILGGISERAKRNSSEEETNDIFFSIVDKIIKGNFDNLQTFKFSNKEAKFKLIRSIKLVICKVVYLLQNLNIKIRVLQTNPVKNIIQYLKNISYLLIFDENIKEVNENAIRIVDFLLTYNFKENNNPLNNENLFLILKNINIIFLRSKKQINLIKKLASLEELIKNQNRKLFEEMKSKMSIEVSKIQLVIENNKILKSNNLRKFILGCFLDQFWESAESIYKQIIDYIKPKDKLMMKEARENYHKLSNSFASLFGVPSTFYLEFVDNWELRNNTELHNYIMTDEYESILSREEEVQKTLSKYNTVELKQQIIMNTRQRVGCDTPKRKIHKIELNHIVEENTKEREISTEGSLENPKTLKRSDSTRSVDLREESAPDKTKSIKLRNCNKKNKVPRYKSQKEKDPKNNKPNDEECNNDVVLNTNNSRDIENSNRTETNPNLKSEGNQEKEKNEPSIVKNTKSLIFALRRIIFNQIIQGLFLKYKENTLVKELEEIKIYHIKPNSKVEVLTLKEKLSNKENGKKDISSNLVIFDQNMNPNPSELKVSPNNFIAKKLEINKKNVHDLNEGVLDINNNINDLKIKPFDLLNIKKPAGKEKLRLRDSNNQNNNNLQEAIRKKFDEINEKLKNYENLAQNLGKEFNKHYNK